MANQIQKTSVTLYTADDKTIKSLTSSYELDYNKDQLLKNVRKINNLLANNDIILKAADDGAIVSNSIFDTFTGLNPKKKIYQMSKWEAAEFLAIFNSDPRNFQLIIDKLSPKALELAMYIARHGVVSGATAERICGTEVLKHDKYSWSREKYELVEPYNIFILWKDFENINQYGYYSGYYSETYITNPYEWQSLLIQKAFPLTTDTVKSHQDNNPGKGRIVNNLKNVSRIVKVLRTMVQTGSIEAGSNKLLTKTAQRRVAETVKMPAVYGDTFPEYYNTSVVTLMTLCSIVNRQYRTSSSKSITEEDKADVADTVRSFFSKLSAIGDEPQFLSELIPGVSRITRATLYSTTIPLYLSQLFNQIFADNSWKSVSDLYREICLLNSDNRNLALFRLCGFYAHPWIDDFTQNRITPDQARERLTFPFIRGVMQLLMSIGCVEIYAEPEEEGALPFSGILFVRPTALGMYAAGKGTKPELEDNDEFICQYELIDRPMLVVSKKEGNPYDAWLSKIAKRQGNRWIVTPGSFMRECTKQDDVETIEKDFKKYICKNPSAVWLDFFKRMKENIGSGVGAILGKTFTVFNINPANKELLEYIARTPEFSKIAIKAEGYKMVVSRHDTDRFIELLRAGGFIIEQ